MAGIERGVLGWGTGVGRLCSPGHGSLVPPVPWAGGAGFALQAGSSGAARGSPWVCCRAGCCGCWVQGSCPGGRVRAWGGTWESQLRHGSGGWGHASSPKDLVALEGEREQRAAAAAWDTPPELLPCVPCPAAEEHSASFMPQLPRLLRGPGRLTSGGCSPATGRCSLCAASFRLQPHSPASVNLLTPPCLALGASKTWWVLVWDAGSGRGCRCVLWDVRGIGAAPGSE